MNDILNGHARCPKIEERPAVQPYDHATFRRCMRDAEHDGRCEFGPWLLKYDPVRWGWEA